MKYGAVATASGEVRVYQNDQLLGTVDVSAWPYHAEGGYIGLWVSNAAGTLLDDFGGGTLPMATQPGWNLANTWGQIRTWFAGLLDPRGKAAHAALKLAPNQSRLEQPAASRPVVMAAEINPPAGQVWRNYILVNGQRVAVGIRHCRQPGVLPAGRSSRLDQYHHHCGRHAEKRTALCHLW